MCIYDTLLKLIRKKFAGCSSAKINWLKQNKNSDTLQR